MFMHVAEVEVTQNRQSFLEGGAVLDIPLSYLEGFNICFTIQILYDLILLTPM